VIDLRKLPKKIVFFLIVALCLQLFSLISCSSVKGKTQTPSIFGKVLDAQSGLPIPHATVIICREKQLGVYLTDEDGRFHVSEPFLKIGYSYRVYAYKGNFTEEWVSYVPSLQIVKLSFLTPSVNVTFPLVPGALIKLDGTAYLVQLSSPGGRMYTEVITNLNLKISPTDLVTRYGDAFDSWFLNLKREYVIVPANVPVTLKTHVRGVEFLILNESLPFNLPQGTRLVTNLSEHSLQKSMNDINNKFLDVSSQVDRAQNVGFVIFEEKESLKSILNKILEAKEILGNAETEKDYLNCWWKLRESWAALDVVSKSLTLKRLIGITNSVYFPAVMAVFSAIMSFFFFEENKKKVYSLLVTYVLLLVLLYFLHPGAHIVMEENSFPFFISASVSLTGVFALLFAAPRIFKERTMEGEVSLRSSTSIIFSMAKRQIKRKRIRGIFTILSIATLVLAFTSLTSIGTVFGIVSETQIVPTSSSGILVKKLLNKTTYLTTPLGSSDPIILKQVLPVRDIALRFETIATSHSVFRLVNPKNPSAQALIFGIVGITPSKESLYTTLENMTNGYLSESDENGILISADLARKLGLKTGENVTLEVLGLPGISRNFTLNGYFDDNSYESMLDLDGSLFGPQRFLSNGTLTRCQSTEIVIIHWKAAADLQNVANRLRPEIAPKFAVLSKMLFNLKDGADLSSVIQTLVYVFGYDVFVNSGNSITHYYVGEYFEVKGSIEFLIPLIMTSLNVGAVMLNAVYERRKEIRILSMVGLNPTFIGFMFVAEAIVIGLVGGSFGYMLGLGFYRVMVWLEKEIMVREKLEWWWSAVGLAIALITSVISSLRPAVLAINAYTPSRIRRIRGPKKQMDERKKEIFKIYQAKELSMPVKVTQVEKEFFISFFLDQLKMWTTGTTIRIENIEEMPEIEGVKGELKKVINFDYTMGTETGRKTIRNNLIMIKSPNEEYYRVRLKYEPLLPGIPEIFVKRVIKFTSDICMEWVKSKHKIIGG